MYIYELNLMLYFLGFLKIDHVWTLERPSREREVVGSIPGRDIPNSLRLVVGLVAVPLGIQVYGNSITTGPPVSGKWTG